MGIFDVFKKKNETVEKPVVTVDEDKVNAVISWLEKNYKKPVIRIKTEEVEITSIFDSKFGGTPYWPSSKAYPTNSKGEELLLLAQMNFERDSIGHPFPEKGMLQFFIDCDDLNGLNFEDQTKQDGFRVVYHESIDYSVKPLSVKTNMILSERNEYFPVMKQYKLSFSKGMDLLNPNVEDTFDEVFNIAIKELFNETEETDLYDYFSEKEYDLFCEKVSGWGHKLLGYPAFTQYDPRDDIEQWNTVLFQMDSQGQDIMWGDSGICNFFINEKDLLNRDFSKVLYNWDCY